jgi:hypothetical protein
MRYISYIICIFMAFLVRHKIKLDRKRVKLLSPVSYTSKCTRIHHVRRNRRRKSLLSFYLIKIIGSTFSNFKVNSTSYTMALIRGP